MRPIAVLALLLFATTEATAQNRVGRIANSVNGRAGQLSVESGRMVGRVDGRIQNRVESRIRNRIDRYYSPQANAASPFAVAGEQLRTASRSRR